MRKDGDQVRITAQLRRRRHRQSFWASATTHLADVFAVQDEITQAVVAAIESQLYAAENFRRQRKPPDSLDAWDLVMRALQHIWRVTRARQSGGAGALGKAIAVRSRLRPGAESVGGLPHVAAHMGCEGMPQAVPAAERAALAAIRADSEDAGRIMRWRARLFNRRFDDCIAQSSSWRCGSIRILAARGSMAWRCPIAGAGRRATPPLAQALRFSPRDPFAGVYCGVAAYCRMSAALRARRSTSPAKRCAAAPISSAPTAC